MSEQNKKIEDRLGELLKQTGAWLSGHFKLTSGRHSANYMQCALLLSHPEHAAYVGELLAERLRPLNPDFITAPAIGGLIIGHEVARALKKPFLFCEREKTGEMRLRRFPAPQGQSFVVVEDVITTGGSVRETGECLQALGCRWLGTGCVVDRSAGKSGLPGMTGLIQLSFPTYDSEDCPLCKELGTEPIKPGSR